jgi:hypothetical protein
MARNTQPTQATNNQAQTQNVPSVAEDIKLVDETHFALWHSEMSDILEAEYEASNGKHGGTLTNEVMVLSASHRTSLILKKSIGKELKARLINQKTPQDIWNYIVKEFSGKDRLRMNRGLFALTNFRPKPNQSMDSSLNELDMILFNLRTAAGSETIQFEELAKIVLLYTLPKAYEHLRHDVESSQDSTYSKAKETIRSFEKSSVFAASLAEQSSQQALLASEMCEHGRRKKNNDCSHCHPSKHPNKLKCKDCKGIGHRSSASKRCSLFEEPQKHQANLVIGRHDDDFAQSTSFAFATKRKEPESNDSVGQNEKKVALSSNDLRNKISNNYSFVLDSGGSTTIV